MGGRNLGVVQGNAPHIRLRVLSNLLARDTEGDGSTRMELKSVRGTRLDGATTGESAQLSRRAFSLNA